MKWWRSLLRLLTFEFDKTPSADEVQFALEFGNFIRALHTQMDVIEIGPNWIDLKDQTDPKRIIRLNITRL